VRSLILDVQAHQNLLSTIYFSTFYHSIEETK